MQRIGIYGGTYNPPHMGHFRAASYARQVLQLDRVLMIPTNISPHKQLPEGSPSPAQRLEMVRLGCTEFEGLEACDIELRREGPSYTWQTVQQLKAEYPGAQLFLLMGTDMFLSFHTWREPRRIMADAALAVFYRGDDGEVEAVEAQKLALEAMGAAVELIKNPVTDISSTELRRLLLLRCALDYLPKAVERYVYDHGFYGTDRCLRGLSLEELERVAVSLLKPGRVAHVLGCRDTAVALAKHWGADERDAARAALLHDITKAFDGPLQLTLARGYGMIPEDFGQENEQTIHALTASVVARELFGEGESVVSAIAAHTTGKPAMTLLDGILWLADYVEPTRNFPGVETARSLAFEDWKKALRWGMNKTITHLKHREMPVAPATAETLKWLQSEERKIL